MISHNNYHNSLQISLLSVPQEVAKSIKHQIQYYFSMANLLTDRNLRRMIESNNRGWVQIKDLLKFNRLRTIITSSLEPALSLHQIEQIIERALKDSTRVKVMKGQIKLKKHFNWERQFKRILYLQGQNTDRQRVIDVLSKYNVTEEGVTIRSGNCWHIVQFHYFNEQQINTLSEQLKQNQPSIKILRIEQFKHYQQLFNQIFFPPQQQNMKKTMRLPPRQLLHYDQFQVKTSLKAPTEPSVTKQIDYQKIFSKYIKSRNKKTVQGYEKHRAQKIAYKKQHKIRKQKQKQSKMEIQ